MQCILYKIYFWKVFHMYYNLICIFICTPICTKFYSRKKWVLHHLGTGNARSCRPYFLPVQKTLTERFLKAIVRLPHLALLIRVARFLVIIVIAGSNHDPLGVMLLRLFGAFGASPSAFTAGFGRCPQLTLLIIFLSP
jgi:hypothetical protein